LFSYFANPEFGVQFSIEEQQSDQPTTRLESRVDDIEILQSREHTDSYAVRTLFYNRIVHFSNFSFF
jgi:hypothetical protein